MRLLVLLSSLALALGMEFDCNTLTPVLVGQDPVELGSGMTPFSITVGDIHQRCSVNSGQEIAVTMNQVSQAFTSFIMMAKYVGTGLSGQPVGNWYAEDEHVELGSCVGIDSINDFVKQRDVVDKDRVTAVWRAPATHVQRSVEFVGAASNGSNIYWNEFSVVCTITPIEDTSFVTPKSPTVSPPPRTPTASPSVIHLRPEDGNEVENPHDPAAEAQRAADQRQHQQEMIDDEIRYSEGEWQIEEERKRREHVQMIEWERQQYEIQLAREEREREERIRWEIEEAEQYDAEEHARQEEEARREQLARAQEEADVHRTGEERRDWQEQLEEEVEEEMDEQEFIDVISDEIKLCLEGTCGASSLFASTLLLFFAIARMYI